MTPRSDTARGSTATTDGAWPRSRRTPSGCRWASSEAPPLTIRTDCWKARALRCGTSSSDRLRSWPRDERRFCECSKRRPSSLGKGYQKEADMAHVVLLRGVNVGGHRTFRPAKLAEQLQHLGAVNIGAAGTFVIRKPVSQAQLRREFAQRLPFDTQIMICNGREITRLLTHKCF